MRKIEQTFPVFAVYRVTPGEPDHFKEFLALLESAEYFPLHIFRQVRAEVSKYNIGMGKLIEIQAAIEERENNGKDLPIAVVLGNQLTPTQSYNLERELGISVIDRVQLVLSIFEQRAYTPESTLQVELARAEYELQFHKIRLLEKMGGERKGWSTTRGGIGRGLGLSRLELFETDQKRRIKTIERQLERLEVSRREQRKRRKQSEILSTSLAGYTCAGKTSLLNALSGTGAEVSPKLFTTLSPLSRRSFLLNGTPFVVTDTIGFIEDLPPSLIAAFRSTLEEGLESECTIVVIDAAEPIPEILRKTIAVEEILLDLGVSRDQIILALNKCDLLSTDKKNQIQNQVTAEFSYPTVQISAVQSDVNQLLEKLAHLFPPIEIEMILEDAPNLMKLRSFIYDNGKVLNEKFLNDSLQIRFITHYPEGFFRKTALKMGIRVIACQ
ncbi:MAG: GTPase HflX [Promethearchaeota archaeon]